MNYLFIISLLIIKNVLGFTDSITVISKDIFRCTEDTSVYVKISYPQLKNMKNIEIQEKINLFLESQFLQVLQVYEEFIAEPEFFEDYPADWIFSFEASFNTTFLSNNFLSIILNYFEFTGGAHGNYSSHAFNIKLSDGYLLKLNDIIKETQFDNLSLLCEQEILQHYNANSLTDAGFFKDEIHLSYEQDFYIKPNCLVIQFDPYEIAPYAFGSVEIELSFDKIKNSFKPYLPFD